MATSGSKTVAVTSWNDLVFSWSVTSQSIENNTSTISWSLKLVAGSSGRISSDVYKNCSVVVNGTTYTGKALINISNNATRTLLTGTTVIKHNDDGTKTFNYSFSQEFAIYFSDTYIGTKTGSGTGTLDTIRRLSTMTITSGLLGSSQTITVTRYDTSFVHTIAYKCGSTRGNIVTNSTATSISFTPPLSLAGNNTTGTKVSVTYTITTSKSGTSYGSTSVTVEHAMPVTVAPSCSVSVSDLPGWQGTYGAYIKGLSKLNVTVNVTPSYGASITSYSTTANGATYTGASFTTDVLKTAGSLTVTAKVKDTRGRTGTGNATLTVLDYTQPTIKKLTVHRCNSDGTENNRGEYVKATFSATVTNLNNKNPAIYTLRYKKTSETAYTSVALTNLANVYAVTDSSYIFKAAADSSYDVELTAADNHGTATRSTSSSTAFTLLHFNGDGTGLGVGKLSEESGLLDVGLDARLGGNVRGNVIGLHKLPQIPAGSNFNNYQATGSYAVYGNADAKTIANMPPCVWDESSQKYVGVAGRLIVSSSTGEGIRVTEWSYLRHTFIPYSLNYPVYERDISRDASNIWSYGEWKQITWTDDQLSEEFDKQHETAHGQKVLWSGTYQMLGTHTIPLNEKISDQLSGIVLVFSAYSAGAAQDYFFHSFFVPKEIVRLKTGNGHSFTMFSNGFAALATKYLYINDATITGHADNGAAGNAAGSIIAGSTTGGIVYNNNSYVLRYVIGV